MTLEDPTSILTTAQEFISAATSSVDPLFIAFYVIVGTLFGFLLGYLFLGVGRTEQRLIGQNYASGYRRGFNEGRKTRERDY